MGSDITWLVILVTYKGDKYFGSKDNIAGEVIRHKDICIYRNIVKRQGP